MEWGASKLDTPLHGGGGKEVEEADAAAASAAAAAARPPAVVDVARRVVARWRAFVAERTACPDLFVVEVLTTLPLHLLQVVLGCLGAADVARAAMTCAAHRQASHSEPLWRGLLVKELGPQAEIILPSALPDER